MAASKTKSKKATTKKKPTAAKRTVAKRTTKSATAAKKRTTAKPATKKKTTAAKATVNAGRITVGNKPYSKSEFLSALAEQTGVSRKDVSAVVSVIPSIIGAHLKQKGPEAFSWPGLFKILVVKKKATKARSGVNPFTGEPTVFKAKPASRKVKIRPLKQLKEMAT